MDTPQIVVEHAAEAVAANSSEPSMPGPGEDYGDAYNHSRPRDRRQSVNMAPGLQHAYEHPPEFFAPRQEEDARRYGRMDIEHSGLETKASIEDDGRVDIKINQKSKSISNILVPALRHQLELHKSRTEKPVAVPVPPGLGDDRLPSPPPMNVVIQIVGSRGDVQPYIALGQVLKNKYGHRVRLATHPTFRDLVTENGLEFFSIGGDPAELMAFMVKNPGLMPGMDALKSGDIGKRRKAIYEMITGCWRSCIEAGDGTDIEASDALLETAGGASGTFSSMDLNAKPFVADVIIANPPSFAHIHIAEKLGIPLHLTFTMPWSPTQSFPHPLANIVSTNADASMTNFVSYALIDILTWQGLGDIINRFREKSLGLEPLPLMWAPGTISRMKVPYTYCWSPALIPRPKDWGPHIDISGFYFLDLATNYTPAEDLKAFLDAGPPPIYIGFGSIVVDDPNAMTKLIFDAVKKTGQRALVSKGWGGFGADQIGIPDGVFMLGNCPHDWLFQRVSCVVHHGGAGTTAAGIKAGRPTVVVPFFGDQPFWGSMVARAGAGPSPVPYKELTADKLAEAILHAIKPESLKRAAELQAQISHETGVETGALQFHQHLNMQDLRCRLDPARVAVWRVKRTDIRLSAFAATVLGNEGLISFEDLKLYRSKEWEVNQGPLEPISGGASALIGTLANLGMGVADFPVEFLKSIKLASAQNKERHERQSVDSEQSSISELGQQAQSSRTSLESVPTVTTPAASTESLEKEETAAGLVHRTASDVSEKTAIAPSVRSMSTSTPPDEQEQATSPEPRSPRSMSTVQSHRQFLRSHSRSGSNSRSSSRQRTPTDNCKDIAGQFTIDSMVGAGKGVSRIVGVGLKSPLDFTMGIAQGFHNAPKLYGDDTVREQEKITGIRSGLKAAGREFTYGFFDGITGLATQPMRGAEKEGPAGFFKGVVKGIGGLVLKPGAGIWGLPGYTFQGIYAEIQKLFGSSVQNYIIAARTAQGYDEWKKSTPEERAHVITVWKSAQVDVLRHGRRYGKDRVEAFERELSQEDLPHGFAHTRHMSWDERKRLAEEKQKRKKEGKQSPAKEDKKKRHCKFCPFHHGDDVQHVFTFPGLQNKNQEDYDFETAIQRSVSATSKGNPQEDMMIGRALRASVAELQAAHNNGNTKVAYDRAVAASVAEANRTRAEFGLALPQDRDGGKDEDDDLARAIRESLAQHRSGPTGSTSSSNPHYSSRGPSSLSSISGVGKHDDEMYQHAIGDSKKEQTIRSTATENTGGEDPELSLAMQESQKNHEDLERAKTEEEIVLEYVKKQSLLEEELRQKKQAEASSETSH